MHLFAGGKSQSRCIVSAFDGKLDGFVPPPGIERRGGLLISAERRRTYNSETAELADPVLDDTFAWTSAGLGKAVADRSRPGGGDAGGGIGGRINHAGLTIHSEGRHVEE